MKDGETVRVARRAVQQAEPSTPAAMSDEAQDPTVHVGAPMPMAWGGQGGLPTMDPAMMQMLSQAVGGAVAQTAPGENPAAQMDAQQVRRLEQDLRAMMQQFQPAAPARGGGGGRDDLRTELERQARNMERQVRWLLAQRRAANTEIATPPVQPAQPPEDDTDEDPELLAYITRTFAEARARGAPVPNARAFVDHALVRAQQRQELQARLDREASGLQPELEDALAAAEVSVAAAARWPRRLGRREAPEDTMSNLTEVTRDGDHSGQ